MFSKKNLYFLTVSLKNTGDFKETYKSIEKKLLKLFKVKIIAYELGSKGVHLHMHAIIRPTKSKHKIMLKDYLNSKFRIPLDQRKKAVYVVEIPDPDRERYYVGYILKEQEGSDIPSSYSENYIKHSLEYYKLESVKNTQRKQKHQRTYDGTLLAKDIYDNCPSFKGYDEALSRVYEYSISNKINIVNPESMAKMVCQIARMESGKCGKFPEKKIYNNDITKYISNATWNEK